MISTTSQRDILDDILVLSYSDYLADSQIELQKDSLVESGTNETPPPLSHSESKSIIKSNFTNIVFCDYMNSDESADSLEAHYQKTFGHSFSSSSIGRLEEWKNQQSY